MPGRSAIGSRHMPSLRLRSGRKTAMKPMPILLAALTIAILSASRPAPAVVPCGGCCTPYGECPLAAPLLCGTPCYCMHRHRIEVDADANCRPTE